MKRSPLSKAQGSQHSVMSKTLIRQRWHLLSTQNASTRPTSANGGYLSCTINYTISAQIKSETSLLTTGSQLISIKLDTIMYTVFQTQIFCMNAIYWTYELTHFFTRFFIFSTNSLYSHSLLSFSNNPFNDHSLIDAIVY